MWERKEGTEFLGRKSRLKKWGNEDYQVLLNFVHPRINFRVSMTYYQPAKGSAANVQDKPWQWTGAEAWLFLTRPTKGSRNRNRNRNRNFFPYIKKKLFFP